MGTPSLVIGDHELRLSRRARALIAYLSFQPDRPVAREAIAELLWSGRFQHQAKASLRQCLTEIRRETRDLTLLEIGQTTVTLLGAVVRTDIQAIEAANGEELADALEALPPGPGLSGLDVSPAFERWISGARASVERRLRKHVIDELDAATSRSEWLLARRIGDAWLTREPRDDLVTAMIMRSDVELRAPETAVARYERLIAPESASVSPLPPIAPPLLIVGRIDGVVTNAPHLNLSLREELLAALARFRGLRLVSEPNALDQMSASDDRGGYALGATLHDGAIIVTLLERSSREVLWCERTGIDSGSAIQNAIEATVTRTAGAVLPTMEADSTIRPHAAGVLYSRYLAVHSRAIDLAGHEEARNVAAELEAIISEAPTFAPPLLALARLYNTDFGYTRAGSSGYAERDRAFALTRRALSLDPRHVHGYTVMGWCHLWRDEWSLAKLQFDQAIALNPFHADRLVEVAFGHLFLGDLECARQLFERCLRLTLSPGDGFHGDRGLLHLLSGDFDRAAEDFSRLHNRRGWVVLYETASLALGGHAIAEARAAAEAWLKEIWPGHTIPTATELRQWVGRQRPFRVAGHRDLLLEGLRLGFS